MILRPWSLSSPAYWRWWRSSRSRGDRRMARATDHLVYLPELTERAQSSAKPMRSERRPVIELAGISFRYPDGRNALDNVHLVIGEQEKVGLGAPNGAR